MTVLSQLRGRLLHAYLNSMRLKRRLYSAGRILRGGTRRARLYYRVDDPYSHLVAQCAPQLMHDYGVSLELVVVPQPSAGAAPEPLLLAEHARRDALVLADRYGLSFPKDAADPPPDRVRRVQAVLLKERPATEQFELAIALGRALWSEDSDALARLVDEHGAVSGDQVRRLLDHNQRRLERAGHYSSAMIHYGGEWFWSLDRLPFLETRLRREGAPRDATPLLVPRSTTEQALLRSIRPIPGPVPLDVYFSFRSPYSYLAIAQLRDLAARYPIDLRLKPVLPMVMRGLPVPRSKVLYIAKDAKREADRLGIPFGRIADPLRGGIGRCFAAWVQAAEQGRTLEFAESAMRGIWSEALSMASDADLRVVTERAGVSWEAVQSGLADKAWKTVGQQHRDELTELGLWGVPSFRLGDYATWGRDRLPMIEERLQKHCKDSEDRPGPLRSDFRL